MRITQLKFFFSISKCASFTSAAEELFISQSTLSKQIIALEKELGARLFDRSSRQIRLTPVGRMILPYVKTILEQNELIIQEICNFQESSSKVIHLCGLPILYPYGLSDEIFHFEQSHSDCRVEISETLTAELLKVLIAGKADIGVVRFDLSEYVPPDGLKLIPLIDDNQVLVVPNESPLANRGSIHLLEAADEEFIQLHTDVIVAAYHLKLLHKHIPSPLLHLTEMKMDSIKSCILNKGWVSIMMRKVANSYYQHGEAAIVGLEEENTVLTLCLMVKKEESNPHCHALIEHLKEKFQDVKYRHLNA